MAFLDRVPDRWWYGLFSPGISNRTGSETATAGRKDSRRHYKLRIARDLLAGAAAKALCPFGNPVAGR
jgi:hypothetical protein